MAVVIPNDQDSPSFIAQAVRDRTDDFAARCNSLGTGVISGMAVTQDTGSDMKVAVASGTVAVNGTTYTYTGTGSPFTITTASSGDRRDVVIYRVGTGVTVLTGTVPTGLTGAWATSSYPTLPPVKPDIVESTDCVLAEVYVAYNTTAIVTATNILDKRNMVGADVLGGALQTTNNVSTVVRASAWQDVTERPGSTGSTGVPQGLAVQQTSATVNDSAVRQTVTDMVIGDSTGGTINASLGITDWGTYLAQMENRNAGLTDPGMLILCNQTVGGTLWSSQTGGAAVASPTVSTVTISSSSASWTVVSGGFPGIVPGMSISGSGGTGSIPTTAGQVPYVVSVSGNTLTVANYSYCTSGSISSMVFSASSIGGPSISTTNWTLATTGQAIGDGMTSTGSAITTTISTTLGSTVATVGAGTNLVAGLVIQGPGIGPNTKIYAISGTTVYLSQPAVATVSTLTATFSRAFRRVQVFYQKKNLSDYVTFAAITPAASTGSGTITAIQSAAGGIGVWDSGDLGSTGLAGGCGVTATWTTGGGGAGATIIGYRYFTTAGTTGVQIDNVSYASTTIGSWVGSSGSPVTSQLAGTYFGWAQWMQEMCNLGTPIRRLYIIGGTNDAQSFNNGTAYASFYTNLVSVIQTAQAVSPLTEVVVLAQWYGDGTGSTYASTSTVSGSNIVSSVNMGISSFIYTPNVGVGVYGYGIPAGTTVLAVYGNTNKGSGSATATCSAAGVQSYVTAGSTPSASIVAGMVVTGSASLAANTQVVSVVGTQINISPNTTGSISSVSLTFTNAVQLSNNCTATATITAYGYHNKGGPANWAANWVPQYETACAATGATLVNLWERIGDVSFLSSVASVASTAGSTTLTAPTGGFPNASVGAAIAGLGIPTNTVVASYSGIPTTTLTMSNPALTTEASQTVYFSADTQGITSSVSSPTTAWLHMADWQQSLSGRDGQRLVAETIYQKLVHSTALPPAGVTTPQTNMVVNAPGATPALNTDITTLATFTGLAAAITSMTTYLTGKPYHGQKLIIEFIDNATPRAITWGASFASGLATLPTTTVASTLLRVGLIYDAISAPTTPVWRCVAVA